MHIERDPNGDFILESGEIAVCQVEAWWISRGAASPRNAERGCAARCVSRERCRDTIRRPVAVNNGMAVDRCHLHASHVRSGHGDGPGSRCRNRRWLRISRHGGNLPATHRRELELIDQTYLQCHDLSECLSGRHRDVHRNHSHAVHVPPIRQVGHASATTEADVVERNEIDQILRNDDS